MGRFAIGSAKALVWAAVSLAVWGGSTAAFAQTFDFTYNVGQNTASPLNVTGVIDAMATGTPGTYQITNIFGTVSGFDPSLGLSGDNGSISYLAAGQFQQGTQGGANDNLFFYPNTPSLDCDGIGFTVNGHGEDINYNSNCGPAAPSYNINAPDNNSFGGGTFSLTETATPAPIPGAGWLSYLVLGFAGLLYGGKRLWSRADNSLARSVSEPHPSLLAQRRLRLRGRRGLLDSRVRGMTRIGGRNLLTRP
jgi:hypothetical protein